MTFRDIIFIFSKKFSARKKRPIPFKNEPQSVEKVNFKNILQFLTNKFAYFFQIIKGKFLENLGFLIQFRRCEPKDKSVTRSVAFNEVESSDRSFARPRTGTVLCSCVARTRNTRLVPTLDLLQEMQAFLARLSTLSTA